MPPIINKFSKKLFINDHLFVLFDSNSYNLLVFSLTELLLLCIILLSYYINLLCIYLISYCCFIIFSCPWSLSLLKIIGFPIAYFRMISIYWLKTSLVFVLSSQILSLSLFFWTVSWNLQSCSLRILLPLTLIFYISVSVYIIFSLLILLVFEFSFSLLCMMVKASISSSIFFYFR